MMSYFSSVAGGSVEFSIFFQKAWSPKLWGFVSFLGDAKKKGDSK